MEIFCFEFGARVVGRCVATAGLVAVGRLDGRDIPGAQVRGTWGTGRILVISKIHFYCHPDGNGLLLLHGRPESVVGYRVEG